jgi:hypothetical protein
MIIDPIVEQLHKQREEYMERFQYDLDAVIRDIKEHEAASQAPLVEPPPPAPAGTGAQGVRFTRG